MKLIIQIVFLLLVIVYIQGTSFAQTTQVKYLSGIGVDHPVEWDFFCTAGRNSGKWTKIEVPSCWEQQGFGKYDYGHAKDSVRGKEQGLYKYEFSVPADWSKKQVDIVFQGSMTDTEVKINGKSAGSIHQGAFYEFRYNISKLLKYGQSNLLEVRVSKQSANESVNKAERHGDYWIFGGIFRPVYLEAMPINHIERVAIDAKADGTFAADVFLAGTVKSGELRAQVLTLDNKAVGKSFSVPVEKGASKVTLQSTIENIKSWNPEDPNLYNVKFELVSNGQPVHATAARFGFRTIEVRQRDGIYVNGVKVKFKGVNRHTFRAEYGRASSKALSIEDVELIKSMNMNAVRMSHYPPDSHFLDVCDSLGLFVLDELTGWHATYDDVVGPKLVKEMVTRDVNHPSIVLWDNGNEGGHNPNFDAYFKEYDIQKRVVIYPWMEHNGIATQHYRPYDYGAGTFWNGRLITMPTEFLHGMYDGGHGAGLYDYWEYIWNKPKAAGGFLWDLFDQGILRTDKDGELYDTDGNHGADGIVGPNLEKEASYYAIKEIWSPVKLEEREITSGWDKKLGVENRYIYTNLKECQFSFKLEKLHLPNHKVIQMVEVGTIPAPDLAPGEKGQLQIPVPANWADFDVMEITATDCFGKELYSWNYPLITASAMADRLMNQAEKTEKLQLTDAGDYLLVQGADVQFTINKKNGFLQQVRNEKGIIPFTNGPDISAGLTAFKGLETKIVGKDSITITCHFQTENADSSRMKEFIWTFYPNGWAKLHLYYFPPEYDKDFDYMGVNFSYPEELVNGVEWLGNGPYRVWKNRTQGVEFGVHQKDYNNTITGVSPLVYPEFKGYHANLYWARIQSKEQSFTVAISTDDVFLRLYTPADPEQYDKRVSPVFPKGDISFMQAIPPIGTKCNDPWNMGPSGLKNKFFDYGPFDDWRIRSQQMTLYFNFSSNQ
ncbi:glycoside hydrolase family 2 TIM barrel-domain containing protein [Mangrovibacterium marinum]|uniref:beta-galactosidase n=1 Tax=Mangrovibacterium marinum TaxID=1639118 RepID=A0A2T5C419_9BACT|nr:glycoside hydrolase family 2 TIM barrel-domain containing protein [Mangrovibacterium marinum]PTN09550.1 beta-galactosidase/beta-glucuronidase [Mangrovibacterium marinum]